MITRRQYDRLSKAEQERVDKESMQYPIYGYPKPSCRYEELSMYDRRLVDEAEGQRWEDIDSTKAESEECRTILNDMAYRRRMAEDMRQDDIDSLMDGWEDYDRIERPY